MTHNLRSFVQAVYAFDAIVQRVGADQWSNDTPCEGWTASDLVEHQCAVVNGVQLVASSGAMARPTPPEDMSDPVAAWNATRDAVLETLDRQHVLGQAGPFWFDTPTVDDLIGVVQWDLVAHTWDLATATGQPHGIGDDLAATVLAVVEPMSDMLVDSGRTAAPLEVADDAPVLDRYLALIGRSPS